MKDGRKIGLIAEAMFAGIESMLDPPKCSLSAKFVVLFSLSHEY